MIEKEGKYIGVVGSLNFSNDGIESYYYFGHDYFKEHGKGEKSR